MKKKINFLKMSGSGNDFVLVDNRRGQFPRPASAWAKRLCHRQEGVGADGLLLLEKSARADFRMVYFNADGSRASMCGNGARCIAWFARDIGAAPAKSRFETDAGIVEAKVTDQIAEITLGEARGFEPHRVLQAGGHTYPVSSVNTGVPHAICFVPRVDAVNLPQVGPRLRYHKAFGA